MASSSSISSFTLKRGSFPMNAINFNKEFKWNDSYLLNRLRANAKLSADFTYSRLLTGKKSLKWGKSQRLSRDGMRCSALEIEDVPTFTMGKKFQLDDVIEAQQFDRDTLKFDKRISLHLTCFISSLVQRLFHFHVVYALLDVYTIEREIGKLDGIRVGLVGDLANGRTVRSLAYLLAKYQDVKIYFVSPDVVKMKVNVRQTPLTIMT
ncbi:hypothetical protein DITRI_Ditri01bG0186400 [Diplodiscus trichospermus]